MTAALCIAPATLLAQVGHRPESSPYRDIRKGHAFSVTGGYFKGDGGRFGIGPHGGEVFGVGYDIRTASTIQIGVGLARGNLERFVIDPTVSVNRQSGPVEQAVTFAELHLHFNVTGGKTWHRLAPYVVGTGGAAIAESTPEDQSGYSFGTKLFFAPGLGLRLFLTDRLHVSGEFRGTFWKLTYPTSFQRAPQDDPSAPPVLGGGSTTEWVSSRWIQAGLSYSFSL